MKKNSFIIRLLLILILSVVSATILMIGVYALPVEPMIENLSESQRVFSEEEIFKKVFKWCSSTLDNYTEAMILQNATYDGDEDLVEKALLNYRYTAVNPYMALKASFAGVKKNVTSYGRYWHGYLVYVKPMLLVFNYEIIRMINTLGIISISLYLIYIMYNNGLKKYIIPFVLTYLLLNPMVSFYLLDYSDLIYIFVIASVITIKKKNIWDDSKFITMFFIIGIVVAFTNFLTYPIVSVGVPLTFYFILDNERVMKKIITKLFMFTFAWGIGYLGMWGSKWVVASIFTKENILLNAIKQVLLRVSSTSEITGEKISVLDVYGRVFKNYFINPIALGLIVVIFICVKVIIKNKLWKNKINIIIPYIFILLLPIGWYFVAFGHSFDHYLFTYKGLMVFAFSLLCMLIKMIESDMEIEEKNKKVKNI